MEMFLVRQKNQLTAGFIWAPLRCPNNSMRTNTVNPVIDGYVHEFYGSAHGDWGGVTLSSVNQHERHHELTNTVPPK